MSTTHKSTPSFQGQLQKELKKFVIEQKDRFPNDEVIKIDLHCHDHNSDVPDELLGRILGVPETWLKTKKLVKTLKKNNVDAITITNHNNARSCYELSDKGEDVLIGAEFSCEVPDYNIGIHVLTYGFTPKQEIKLNQLRKNIYQFLQYTNANNLPTIWAHPLYYYSSEGIPPFDFFSKMVLIFERFEVINGQRDTWQNILVKTWLEQITPEQIDKDAKKFDIDINLYCKNPYKKSMSGGSDSHMGIFSGQTGTYLHIPQLQERLKTETPSELALEALRNGDMAPYGNHQNSEKLTVAFLEYVFQIAMHQNDPGLMRILLHKGTTQDKMLALLVSNAFAELRRHKVTMSFIEMLHGCFIGKTPSKSKRIFIPKIYKPLFDEAEKIAKVHTLEADEMVRQFNEAVNSISYNLNKIFFDRLSKKIDEAMANDAVKNLNIEDIIERIEVPSEIRSLIKPSKEKKLWGKKRKMTRPDISGFMDGLPFPLLASTVILAANFTSAKVLYNSRPLLETFAQHLGKHKYPQRLLWLTDTFHDKNGVSTVLQEMHKEVKRRNLPIDFLVCSNTIQPDDHLIVVKPMAEFAMPFYAHQQIRIPYFNEIHHLFLDHGYDRIMCSTEGIMGAVALYLKNAYSISTNFFIHTDWIMFAQKTLKLDKHNLDRLQRYLRAYYKGFDHLFVLNTEHQKWLSGSKMEFAKENIILSAHWAHEKFKPLQANKEDIFGFSENTKVLLFAGRLSNEKGVTDLVKIYNSINNNIPDLKMVFAGTGPAEDFLKQEIPDAIFLGWVDNDKLPEIYSSADLLILPTRFDTFSCVTLEAMSCGLPVIAYNTKGPKDIIVHNESGYLASSKSEMANYIQEFFDNPEKQNSFKTNAIQRSKDYSKIRIVDQLIEDLELC